MISSQGCRWFFFEKELIRLWNSILPEPGQPSTQLSKLIRLTACKKTKHTVSRWYRTVYIPWLVASYDTHKSKRWLNSNPPRPQWITLLSPMYRLYIIKKSCYFSLIKFVFSDNFWNVSEDLPSTVSVITISLAADKCNGSFQYLRRKHVKFKNKSRNQHFLRNSNALHAPKLNQKRRNFQCHFSTSWNRRVKNLRSNYKWTHFKSI